MSPQSSGKPRISVVMVDGSFRENFHAVDFLARQDFPAADFEAIWVEYYDRLHPALEEKLKSHPALRALKLGRTGEYHSSYCFNAGIQAARGELILIPDADLAMEPDFLARQWELHAANENLVTYSYRYNEPQAQSRRPAGPEASYWCADLEHLKRVGVLTHPSNWGACLGVRKRWLLEVNGYEQAPVFASGDHGNDFDMYVRLKNLGLAICWPREPALYHAWHPGTLVYAYSHKLQAIVTRRRAHELDTLAYAGIDPARNRPMPDELLEEIETARARFEAERPGAATEPETATAPAAGSPPWLIRDHEGS